MIENDLVAGVAGSNGFLYSTGTATAGKKDFQVIEAIRPEKNLTAQESHSFREDGTYRQHLQLMRGRLQSGRRNRKNPGAFSHEISACVLGAFIPSSPAGSARVPGSHRDRNVPSPRRVDRYIR